MFATPAELELRLGEEISVDLATMLLEQASDLIRNWTGQTLSLVEDDVEDHLGDGNPVILLREYNTSAHPAFTLDVTSVTVDDDLLDESEWTVTPTSGVLYRRPTLSGTILRDAVWPKWAKVSVTYTHGFDAIPNDIVKATLDIARMGVVNPTGVQREQIGNYAITFPVGTPSGRAGPTPAEAGILASLSRYQIRR